MGFLKRAKWSRSGADDNLNGKQSGETGDYMPIASSAMNAWNSVNSPDFMDFMHVTVYFLLGAGFLIPWHSFITAADYFGYIYPNSHIDRVFTVVYLIPCLIGLVILIPYGGRYSIKGRINVGLVMYLFCVVVFPFMDAVFINGKRGSILTYIITISAVMVTGIADSIVQGTLIGSAAELPDRYTRAVVAGTGFSGVLISLLRIITKASFEQTVSGMRRSANLYFGVGAFFMVLCIVSYNLIPERRIPKSSPYYSSRNCAIPSATVDYNSLTETSSGLDLENHHEDDVDSPDSKMGIANRSRQTLHPSLDSSSIVSEEWTPEGKDVHFHEPGGFREVLFQIRWVASGIGLSFMVTLIILPGVFTEDVESATLGDWYGVLLITTFNVFDLLAKFSSALCVPRNQVSTIVGSLIRVLFIPLFAICVHGPKFLRTEFPMFFMSASFGFTHGLLMASFFVVTPTLVHSANAQPAAIVMVVALQTGLTIGSFFSWFWVI